MNTANKRKEDLYVNGDVFDKSIIHPSIVTMLLEELSRLDGYCFIDYGNHDQSARSDDLSQTSFGILEAVKKITTQLQPISASQAWVPYGKTEVEGVPEANVVFLHTLTVEKQEDAKFFDAVSAKELLNTYQDFQFIATSDNHKAFVYEHKGRKVLNPGCITKQSAAYKDAKLLVYSLNEVTGEHEAIYLPEDNDVVDDSYLVEDKDRENRIGAFVESLKQSGEVSLSFKDNVASALKSQTIKALTRKFISEIMEEASGTS